jgi:hypothetical protein
VQTQVQSHPHRAKTGRTKAIVNSDCKLRKLLPHPPIMKSKLPARKTAAASANRFTVLGLEIG